jgi:L-amino acid N-acyltransferase YncA
MLMMNLRLAQGKDAEGILDIYAPFIRDTSYTFETDVPSMPVFAERINGCLINWPWLVVETEGIIAGYAYGARHRERKAYQWCVESSVYIHPDYQKKGVGRALYTALLAILKEQGYYNVYAVINLPNDGSVSFHESCGFSWFATYKKVGFKLGRWKDVGWWQYVINEYRDNPPDPLKFELIDQAFLAATLRKSGGLLHNI